MFLSKKISYLQVYIFVRQKADLNHCAPRLRNGDADTF